MAETLYQERYQLTGRARLEIALRRLNIAALPDDLADALALEIRLAARQGGRPERYCPMVGRLSA